jgi:hypothetical protein
MTASTPFEAGAGDDRPSPAPAASTATRVRARRRPSGEPPPLPRQLHTSGRRWLLLVGVVVVAAVVIGNVQRAAVAVDLADHAVLSAFVGIRTPWLTQAARPAGCSRRRSACSPCGGRRSPCCWSGGAGGICSSAPSRCSW